MLQGSSSGLSRRRELLVLKSSKSGLARDEWVLGECGSGVNGKIPRNMGVNINHKQEKSFYDQPSIIPCLSRKANPQ